MEAIRQASLDAGAFDAVVSNHWAEGGKGAEKLAEAVVKACKATKSDDFKFLYELNISIREKVEIISKEIYGADGVDFSELAEQQMVSVFIYNFCDRNENRLNMKSDNRPETPNYALITRNNTKQVDSAVYQYASPKHNIHLVVMQMRRACRQVSVYLFERFAVVWARGSFTPFAVIL